MDSVVERFDSEPVAGGEQHLVEVVPQNERELPAQLLHAMGAEFLKKV
jgi:hypothetical protein